MADIGLSLTMMGTPTKVSPIQARVTSTEYKHDIAEILVHRPLLNELTPYWSGAPLRLDWHAAQRGRSGTFYGYFDRLDAPFARMGGQMDQSYATLRCYGVSYPMKNEGFSTYSNYTADAIARDVARNFRMSFVVDPHPFQLKSYAQLGKSWWAMLVDLANRIGFTLYVVGSTLFFVDRRTAGGYVRIPHSYVLGASPTSPIHAINFDPTISSGDGVDSKRAGHYVARGVSDYSNQTIEIAQSTTLRYGSTLVQPKAFERSIPDRSPTSIEEAQMYVDAAEAQSLFTAASVMTVKGNAALSAGGLVDLSTAAAKFRQFVGTWYIKEAVQNLNPASYTTTLRIGTDAAGAMFSTPKKASLNRLTIPPTAFAHGVWQSKWAQ